MNIKTAILTLLLGSQLVFAVDLKDAPDIRNRTMPEVSSGAIFSYHEAIKDSKRGVVNIATQKKVSAREGFQHPFMNDPFFRRFFGDQFGDMVPRDRVERSLGSGVIISEDGYIVTNNHVIDGADQIIVTLPGSTKEHKAKLVGKDPKSDLAVIKIEGSSLQYLKFADSSQILEGDVVFAIGNPFGVGETVTQGIVSALNKSGIGINDYENFIQTDASINPGNSGGALIDTRGALIGINTAILSRTGGNHGIGFAIPSSQVKRIVSMLIDVGEVQRGFLGVTIQNISEELRDFYKRENGAIVVSISKDSPADKAGLRRGDLIIAIDGKEIRNSADLKNTIGSFVPGKEVKVVYVRDGNERDARVKLERLPEGGSKTAMSGFGSKVLSGLEVQEVNDNLRSKYRIPEDVTGVVVVDVEERSEAEEYGFRTGDVIIQVEMTPVESVGDLNQALRSYGDRNKRLFINRQGVDRILVIP